MVGGTWQGSAGNDTMSAALTDTRDEAYAHGGNDLVDAKGGNDLVHDGTGADSLDRGAGRDVVHGDDDDWIGGGAGGDRLFGEAGNDTIHLVRAGLGPNSPGLSITCDVPHTIQNGMIVYEGPAVGSISLNGNKVTFTGLENIKVG